MNWNWCCNPKQYGGLGLKDIKLHGIALASKWILKAIDGNEPSKVPNRNDIEKPFISKGKKWENVLFSDILLGDFKINILGLQNLSHYGRCGLMSNCSC